MSLVFKIKRLREDAKIPQYAHPGDAGLDLFAVEDVTLAPNERAAVPMGIAMEIPDGHVGLIWDKSGLSIKHGLKTLGGVIDSEYRGEILVGVINLSDEKYTIRKGEKVAQMIIQRKETILVEEAVELSYTVRGKGGFGSTGK
ncbi:MAG: dUTP diphosphatase [Parcubacteria group bacterium]|nr:dUTP diphosphatase [Parcubacteria group bacterium]